jgi:hypothetical protein
VKRTRVVAGLLLVLVAAGVFAVADVASSHWSQGQPAASPPTGTPSSSLAASVSGSATFEPPTPQPPTSEPSTSELPASARRRTVYVAGYGWWDNTPPGSSEISDPVLHKRAGGTGTYADPITAAVPYHCAKGCLQWPAGTRFYLPSLHRYAIVEDTCGDDGPDSCDGSNGNELILWVGRGSTAATAGACEDRITGRTTAVEDPAADLAVTPGDIC